MTFRNDHDAAIARADALERELDATKATVEETAAELAKSKAARARLEAEVAALRVKGPMSVDDKPTKTSDPLAWMIPVGGLVLVLVLMFIAWGLQ